MDIDKLLGGCPGYPLGLTDSEIQIWLNAQRAMIEVGYRKPQQPTAEGELLSKEALRKLQMALSPESYTYLLMNPDGLADIVLIVQETTAKAQRAHMIAQGYRKLPSKDELADMLEQVYASNTGQPHSAWPLNKITRELLELLGEKP